MKNERRNKRLYKTISCIIVFFVCVFAFVSLAVCKASNNKVKADTPTLYYFDIDTSHENYMTIILYVLDVANLEEDTCNMYLLGTRNQAPYSYFENGQTIQFSRYTQLDHEDYDAYIYNYNYPTLQGQKGLAILVYTYQTISFDNNELVGYNLYLPYYPTYKLYYEDGKNYGYDLGVNNTTDSLNEYWNNYINDTYISTSGSGYQEIFQRGRNDGINANIGTQNWFITAFGAVDSFLNIRIFPNITFGVLLGIPFVISIVWFIIRMFRGGGGGD